MANEHICARSNLHHHHRYHHDHNHHYSVDVRTVSTAVALIPWRPSSIYTTESLTFWLVYHVLVDRTLLRDTDIAQADRSNCVPEPARSRRGNYIFQMSAGTQYWETQTRLGTCSNIIKLTFKAIIDSGSTIKDIWPFYIIPLLCFNLLYREQDPDLSRILFICHMFNISHFPYKHNTAELITSLIGQYTSTLSWKYLKCATHLCRDNMSSQERYGVNKEKNKHLD